MSWKNEKGLKVVVFDTPSGQYIVPLYQIAKRRATYYLEEVPDVNTEEDFEDEIDFIMNDDYEGIDWLFNNMNWEDIENISSKINDKVNVTDDDFWSSTDQAFIDCDPKWHSYFKRGM